MGCGGKGCMLSLLHPFRTCRIFFRVSLGKSPFKPNSRKGRKYAAALEAREEKEARAEEVEEAWEYRGQYEKGFDEVDEEMEMEI